VIGVWPSVTYPSHATLVTGVSPERHGILYNKPFDPLGRADDGTYWFAEDLRVPTLWDVAEQSGLRTASVDWPVTIGANISHDIVQYGRAGGPRTSDEQKLFRALSGHGLLAETERAVGPYPYGPTSAIEDDERRAAASAYLLETRRPRLHLAYFGSLDEAQHRSGPGSESARRALERLDAVVGRLRSAAERAAGGPTVVAVVSDHGFTRTHRELPLSTPSAQ
jgi:predicted AlkP superfamily pyrophosphatase or phosphodiesterase